MGYNEQNVQNRTRGIGIWEQIDSNQSGEGLGEWMKKNENIKQKNVCIQHINTTTVW